jgi:hypothetical protein
MVWDRTELGAQKTKEMEERNTVMNFRKNKKVTQEKGI